MTDPGLGSSDLGGGDAVLMRCKDFFLSQRGWRGNEKHESKLEYWNVIRPGISLPDPHVYSIMMIFKTDHHGAVESSQMQRKAKEAGGWQSPHGELQQSFLKTGLICIPQNKNKQNNKTKQKP